MSLILRPEEFLILAIMHESADGYDMRFACLASDILQLFDEDHQSRAERALVYLAGVGLIGVSSESNLYFAKTHLTLSGENCMRRLERHLIKAEFLPEGTAITWSLLSGISPEDYLRVVNQSLEFLASEKAAAGVSVPKRPR